MTTSVFLLLVLGELNLLVLVLAVRAHVRRRQEPSVREQLDAMGSTQP